LADKYIELFFEIYQGETQFYIRNLLFKATLVSKKIKQDILSFEDSSVLDQLKPALEHILKAVSLISRKRGKLSPKLI
jgi:hypothetical protein